MSGTLGKDGPNAGLTTRASGILLQQALIGACIPVLFGTRRCSHNLIWYGDFTSTQANEEGKGGSGGVLGKGGQAAYVYSASILTLICEGEVDGIDSVWDQQGMYVVQSTTETTTVPAVAPYQYTVQNSGENIYNLDKGVSAASAYSVNYDDYGDPNGPGTLTGTQQIPLTKVSSNPGPGEYSISDLGTYTLNQQDTGTEIQITYTYYRYVVEEQQVAAVPNGGGTVTVDHQPYFQSDQGVCYDPSGIALRPVSGTPTMAGTYNPNGGNYLFSAGDSLQLVVINYIWNNPETDSNAPNTLNMTIINGVQGQEPWDYLTSNYPASALGYTARALIGSQSLYLGYTPTIPNFSYELSGPFQFGGGIVDCCPADCIEAMLTNPVYGVGMDPSWIDSSLQGIARDYWLANNFFISEYLKTQSSAASVMGKWLEASMVAAFWSEGLLKFIPAGTATAVANGATYTPPTTPIVTFSDTDYMCEAGADPVTFSRVPWLDAYNQVKIEWSARISSYDRQLMIVVDEASADRWGTRPESPRSYQFITTQVAAQFAANMRLQRLEGVRNTYSFTVKSIYDYLEPMDVVGIEDPEMIGETGTVPSIIPVRITKTTNDPKKGISMTAEDLPYEAFFPAFVTRQANAPSNDLTLSKQPPDNTTLLIIDVPAELINGQGNTLYIFATPQGTNWGGCVIYYSYDNINYSFLARVGVPARMGSLVTALPEHSDPDTVDTLVVNMTNPDAQLLSISDAAADNLVTLSALVTTEGDLEFISYGQAELTGTSTYSMTYLRRGQVGTTPIEFPVGSTFVRMDGTSTEFQYSPIYVGKTIYLKALSMNSQGQQQQNITSVEPLVVPLTGVGAIILTETEATTQEVSDNSNKIATTAFVKSAIASMMGEQCVQINGITVSGDYDISFNLQIGTAGTPVRINGNLV